MVNACLGLEAPDRKWLCHVVIYHPDVCVMDLRKFIIGPSQYDILGCHGFVLEQPSLR